MTAERRPRTGQRRLIMGAVVVALGLVPAACSVDPGSPTPTSTASTGNPETIDPSPSSTGAASSPSTANSTSPTPRRTDSGIRVTARVNGDDGTFEVTEVIRLSEPVSAVTLRPPDLKQLGGDLGRAKPAARDVTMTAGGRSVELATHEVRALTTVTLARPARRIELRYRLTGVTQRSEPSAAGRALAGIGPLIAGVPDDLTVAMAVPGRTVRNLQCPTAAEQSCAVGPPGHLRIARPLPWNVATVVIQLDMT